MTTARRSSLAALLAAFAVTACGCTSETTTTTTVDAGPTTVAFDANMRVVSPLDGACFPVPDGADATIPLTVDFRTANGAPALVFLRPSGFCSAVPSGICGHLVVTVNGVPNNDGVTHTVNVLLRKFVTPYQKFAITVALVGDAGNTLLVARPDDAGATDLDAGITLQTSLTVDAQKSCGSATSTSSSGAGGSSATSSGSAGGADGG
jgi:hypothetical protein